MTKERFRCPRCRSGNQWAPDLAMLVRGDGRREYVGGRMTGCEAVPPSQDVIPVKRSAEPGTIGTLGGREAEGVGGVAPAHQPLPASSRTRPQGRRSGIGGHGDCGVLRERFGKALGSPVPGRASLARDDEPRGWCARACAVRDNRWGVGTRRRVLAAALGTNGPRISRCSSGVTAERMRGRAFLSGRPRVALRVPRGNGRENK